MYMSSGHPWKLKVTFFEMVLLFKIAKEVGEWHGFYYHLIVFSFYIKDLYCNTSSSARVVK